MGKFKENSYHDIYDSLIRWENYGVLNTITDLNAKKLVSIALDIASRTMLMSNYLIPHSKIRTLIIPIIVKIFKDTDKIFDFEELEKEINILINDFQYRYKTKKNDCEDEFCLKYCNEYIL